MSRLTLRLPETLHRQLETQAKREGISLNQFIVYALTQQLTQSYTVHALPAEEVAHQRTQFSALLHALRQASPEVLNAALAARDHVEPEPELDADVVARLQAQRATIARGEASSD